MSFNSSWFSFELSLWFVLLAVGLILLLFKKRKDRSEAKKVVDHGVEKPQALSKITSMPDGTAIATLKLLGPILATPAPGSGLKQNVTYGDVFSRRIGRLADSSSVAAIIVDIATPGGSPAGSELIREAIVRAQEKKPVFVFVSDMSASGGMWAQSTAKQIFASPVATLGSIGVMSGALLRYKDITKISGFLGQGVEAGKITGELMFSGEGKGFGHPFAPEDDYAKGRFQKWLDGTRERFFNLVTSRPGVDGEALRLQGASVFGAKQALDMGLIDGIMSRFELDEYVAQTVGKAITDLKFVTVERVKKSPMDSFFSLMLPDALQMAAHEMSEKQVQSELGQQPALLLHPQFLKL